MIEAIETAIIDLPTIRPHAFASLSIDRMSFVFVQLRTQGGVVGIGEACVPGGPWWGGESVESMEVMIRDYLGPALVGINASQVEVVRDRMARLMPGNRFAKSALEMAAFDAWGKAARRPLVELLGGISNGWLPVTWALSAGDISAVVEDTRERLAMGHTGFKLKMGSASRDADLKRVETVMGELEGRAHLIVDPNGSWDEVDARWFGRELHAVGVECIEQPVPQWNRAALKRIARFCHIPLMADESVITIRDAIDLIADGSVGVFSLKIPKAGGLIDATTIARIAESAGIRCFGGSTLEGTIGAAAAMALYASRPTLTRCELIGPQLLADDIAIGLPYENGAVGLPEGNGLGVVVDEDKLAHYSR